jgi:hypothetical protein
MLCTDSGVPPASCFPPSCDQRSQAELTSAPAQVATASEVAETTICTCCRKQYAHFPWILQGLRGRAIDCPLHVTTHSRLGLRGATLCVAVGVVLQWCGVGAAAGEAVVRSTLASGVWRALPVFVNIPLVSQALAW